MPKPLTVVYQRKGKKHVQYIKAMAMRIWKETYNCHEDDDGTFWHQSIKDAMSIHRNYLKTGTKARLPKYVDSSTPPKDEGSYWRDSKSGIWVPMSLN